MQAKTDEQACSVESDPLVVPVTCAKKVARPTVLQRGGTKIEADEAERIAQALAESDELLPGIEVEKTLEFVGFGNGSNWRFHNEGKMHFTDELNPICDKNDPEYLPPGQSCLSKQEMNKLDLEQLMESEWQMRYGDQNGEAVGGVIDPSWALHSCRSTFTDDVGSGGASLTQSENLCQTETFRPHP